MTQLRDPYVVLGLPRSASLDEVKRAYRRLAKQHHPDSGGERTLARFLEIQAAYEQLVHGRPGAPGSVPGGATRASWQADPARADATRRAYGRGRRTGARTGSPPPPPSGAEGTTREDPRAEPRRRGPRKATLGSTSYDEAADQPFDPDWAGGSWYGTTSGTYWTLNPREYADPRKHGPEYQARARRQAGAGPEPDAAEATGAESPMTDAPEESSGAQKAAEAAEPAEPANVGAAAAGAGPGWRPTAETSTGTDWSATPGSAREPNASPGDRRRPPIAEPPSAAGDAGPGIADIGRLLDPRARRSPAGRIALALGGAVPIAIWLAWLLGELTGCGRFAATCEPQVVTAAWVIGFVLVVALVLLPGVAAILVAGTAGALVAAIPATVFLTATGGARMPQESSAVLGVALILGWLAGVAFAINHWLRRSAPPGPVS
jgi:hypothetical protein